MKIFLLCLKNTVISFKKYFLLSYSTALGPLQGVKVRGVTRTQLSIYENAEWKEEERERETLKIPERIKEYGIQ